MHLNEALTTSASRNPSQAEIADIISQSTNPSLRNLRITQCYSELSRAISSRVGRENVNWCTFATWASKTAGRFIRLAHFDEHVHAALEECFGTTGWSKTLRDRLKDIPGGRELSDDIIVDAARSIAVAVSAEIAAGNLAVFAELAPLFSATVDAMEREQAGDREPMDRVLGGLKLGTTSHGGQDLLRQAFADFRLARFEANPRRKAELMLRANAQVGAHEQIRLQDPIQRAMTAPLADTVTIRLQRKLQESAVGPVRPGIKAMLDGLLRPYRAGLEEVWLRISTRYLMTLELPNGTLHLGRDLPNAPGQPLFPPHLVELQDGELLRILRIYRAGGMSARGSGASEWSNLSDRMRYILELFRSRQQDARLFELPFDAISTTSIQRGEVPLIGV